MPLQLASAAPGGGAGSNAGALVPVAGWPSFERGPGAPSAPADAATRAKAAEALGKLPLYFIENRGQTDARVAYYVQGSTTNVYFTKTGVVYALASRAEGNAGAGRALRRHAIHLDFEGANPEVTVEGRERTEAVVSYFKGPKESWKTGAATFGGVVYRELWPGIDLEYTGGETGTLKYTYVVHPGADPRRIRVSYAGASGVRRTEEGRLEVRTPIADLVEDRPYVYQELDGRRVAVESEYQVLGPAAPGEPERVGYRIGRYDATRPLYVDPAVLRYCGFIGGSSFDEIHGIAVDASGNAYVVGETASTEASFPETAGSLDTVFNGAYDVFVAKINPGGTALVYCGYIGGSGSDSAGGIAVDSSGNAYVAGSTYSNESSFPVTVGPDTTYNETGANDGDAFVAKINSAGTALVYCGYIGGDVDDTARGVAVDSSGYAYVIGYTLSTAATFPDTGGPDLTHNGGADAFVAKVGNTSPYALVYSGYIGGSGIDYGTGIAVDASGSAYVSGYTDSTAATFPVKVGPDVTHNGGYDVFVAKLVPNPISGTLLNNYVYIGYIGGSGWDRVGSDAGPERWVNNLAIDSSGYAYVVGYTDSTQATFPDVGGPDLTYNGGANDGFVARVQADGTGLVYCGYVGGSGDDDVHGIALDSAGNVYLAGQTSSNEASFPVVVGPDLSYNGGANDAFVAKLKLNPTDATVANNYVYNGYIGGNGDERAYAVAVLGYDAYVAGFTSSTEATFPDLVGPDLSHNGGTDDGFVAKLSGEGGCCSLSTTEVPGSTVTVTGAGQFEMRFNTATGGGVDTFYDLAEDPGRATDLAAGTTQHNTLLTEEIVSGGTFYRNDEGGAPGHKLDLLEATTARTRVRADSSFKANTTTYLAGLKAVGDYSVYPSGRAAVRWSRSTTTVVPYTDDAVLDLVVHYRGGPDILSNWATYSQAGLLPPDQLTGAPHFLLSQIEQVGARTDFLLIRNQDWAIANGIQRWVLPGEETLQVYWDTNIPSSYPAGFSDAASFLLYFKPTNLGAGANPWLDTAVTTRSTDYRTHPAGEITINAGKGLAWSDTSENTAGGDWFNEAEAVYPLELHQTLGLDFDLDGSTKRYSPFFKIRGWRSFVESPAVTLEGVALRKNVDYKAAVKPFARAYVREILWYSSLDSAGFVTTPDIGSPGTVTGAVGFVAARYGSGASTALDTRYVSFPTSGNFDKAKGGISFWYQPTYASSDGLEHDLAGTWSSATNAWYLKKAADNNLYFRIVTSAGTSDLVVAAANYSWRASDWVHLRLQWDDAAPLATQQRLFVNGREPPRTAPVVDYNSALFTPGANFVISNVLDGTPAVAPGIYDEFYSYGPLSVDLAHGGLVGQPDEYLADPALNYTLNLAQGPWARGPRLFVGTDTRFRGINFAFAQAGVGLTAADATWETKDSVGGWSWLSSGAPGFTDGTNGLTKNGTVYWTGDPAAWELYSIDGGPDLYYVRVNAGDQVTNYSVFPREAVIKPDVLLFQYCGDVSAAAQTFVFGVPPTTEVKLQSFSAVPGDGLVLLEWRTASELDNLGFHLYRGLLASGPWTRLTSSLIPGLGSSATGQAYSFRDVGLTNGTTYYYRLEDVDASSKTTSHGPVSVVPVAGAPGGAPGSAPPASTSPGTKKKGAASVSCPDWVVAAYGSTAGASASSAALSCTRHGDPEAVSLSVVSRDSRQATLELRTGGFYALHTLAGAGEASGKVRLFVPGFDFPQDPQAPALPFRRALVDAVVGRRAQLGGVRALEQVSFKGLVPVSLGQVEMQVSRDGTVRAGRRAVRESAPQHVLTDLARLLPSVFQGEMKSAVVQITPLRFDARRQQIVLSKRVLVKLLFTARETGENGRGRFGRRERPPKLVTGELLARLYTTGRGLHAVSFEQLFPDRQVGFASSQLRLERQGQAQGFHVAPASDAFGPGSVLYFHADTTASSTDFSSETAWELLRARDGLPMPLVSAPPSGAAVSGPSTGRVSFETNRFYQPGLLEAPDLWLWEALGSGATRAKTFSLSGVDSASSRAAELEVFLQGASESGNPVDHHVSVSLNGVPVGEAQFAGKKPFRMNLSVPQPLLREGANELQLTNVADTGVSSFVFLDRFTIAHPQLSSLAGGRFDGWWPESGSVSVSASGAVSEPVRIVDVTAPVPVWLTGFENVAGTVRFRVEAGHRYRVESDSALMSPRIEQPQPSSLKSAGNQADYLLIAPRAFLAAAEPLVARRADQGLTTRAVAFEEISDEFGHGRPSAEAIKSFLAYAFQSWARPSPRYVLLLGDSTYDPRNFIGTSQPSPLPALWTKTSYLWTVSDPELAAVNGEDALPDLAIGRLPAATVEQAEALVSKLIAWEDSGQGLSGAAALVADNPDLAGDFEADVEDIRASFLASREARVLKLSELGAQTRPSILDALDSGLSFLSYVGHGGAAVWASENVWNSWDAPKLQAQSQQPLLVTMNCLNGYFVAPAFESLSESLLKAEGRGAIASFSPSGLSLDGPAHQYHRALMAELAKGTHARLGDAILAAQKAYAQTGLMPELIGVYHLLGDPAMRVQ